jgi:hypothetical protein
MLEGDSIRIRLRKSITPSRVEDGSGLLRCDLPAERRLADFDVIDAMCKRDDDRPRYLHPRALLFHGPLAYRAVRLDLFLRSSPSGETDRTAKRLLDLSTEAVVSKRSPGL